MRNRCRLSPGSPYLGYYYFKGVRVCDRWQDFALWVEDVGNTLARNPDLEMDRIDPQGPYSPENVRLVPHRANMGWVQGRNMFHVPGVGCNMLSRDVADCLGMPYNVTMERLRSIRRHNRQVRTADLAAPVTAGPDKGKEGDVSWLDPALTQELVLPVPTGGCHALHQ